jgi:glucokinase
MHYVGVDLGATNVRAAVGDRTGTILGHDRAATPGGASGAAVTDAVVDVVRTACSNASVSPASVVAAGVGAMGRLDPSVGGVRVPSNLADDLGPIPLVDPLSSLLDTDSVFLHGDTVAGVIGERFFSYPAVDDLAYLTISSGIGAGIVTGGEVLSGWNGNAGEVGHTTIDADGTMTCGCGRDGHWEAYCSGNNVPRFARVLHEADPVETALPLDSPEFTAADVFAHAGRDAFADRVVERVAELNVLGVANLVHSYAPRVVSVGGAVALNNPDHVVDAVRTRLDDAVLVDVPEMRVSDLGEEAVLKGALASALTGGTGDPTAASGR